LKGSAAARFVRGGAGVARVIPGRSKAEGKGIVLRCPVKADTLAASSVTNLDALRVIVRLSYSRHNDAEERRCGRTR
jgi:hypothetical protein